MPKLKKGEKKPAKITPKREKFCQLIAVGKNQSDAYRGSFNAKRMKPHSIHVEADKLMKDPDITRRIKKLSVPIVEKVRKNREDYLDIMEGLTYHDPGKMFDSHGNPLEIREMPFAERMAIAGYEFEENFTKVQKASGGSDAVPTGFTKKFKIIDRHKYALTYGKMMGFISDDPPAIDLSNLCINVMFVNSDGSPAETLEDARKQKTKVINPSVPEVTFAG